MSEITVVREPLTYERHAPRSYFRDLVDAEQGDFAAGERIARHTREMGVEMELRDRAALEAKPLDLEYRVAPNRTAGKGGNFAPPLWLIDLFATAPRPKRVLADLVPSFPLPQGVQSVNLPRLTTGNAASPVSDSGGNPSADAVDAQVSSPVVTISGHGDVAIQALDQSPPGAHLDWAFFRDLTEAYDAALETQLINGSGTGAQLTGLLTAVASTNKVTYTDSTPTATEMATYLGQVLAAVGNNRKLPPEYWLMTTSRLAWLASSEDAQSRPLLLSDLEETGEVDIFAYAVRPDDAIPITLGAGANQDTIIACRPSDAVLLESAPHLRVHLDVLSGTLQARIQLHCYAAALLGRHPASIATLTGTGLVVQSGF